MNERESAVMFEMRPSEKVVKTISRADDTRDCHLIVVSVELFSKFRGDKWVARAGESPKYRI
jgi:predicted ATP-grasp superfamily ATP-dependent carboligase